MIKGNRRTRRLSNVIADLLREMDWDPRKDPNFKDTPNRVAKWYDIYNGLSRKQVDIHVKRHLKRFPTEYTGIIKVGPTKVFSLCPHHLLPIEYDVRIGIIPAGYALGLSKYTRVAIEMARYPFIQEDYTKHLAEIFQKGLNCKGVIVSVDGIHNCMRCRGVKDLNASTVTSYLTGVFDKPSEGHDPVGEFYRMTNHGK